MTNPIQTKVEEILTRSKEERDEEVDNYLLTDRSLYQEWLEIEGKLPVDIENQPPNPNQPHGYRLIATQPAPDFAEKAKRLFENI